MDGEASHLQCFGFFAGAIAAMGERDIEYFACSNRIFSVCLIEIATAKQQYRIRVLVLYLAKLSHHWGFCCVYLCHIFLFVLKI